MKLSPSEQKVYDLVCKGLCNKEIAVILSVSVKTIKFHITNIFYKTGYTSRAELIAKQHERQRGITIEEVKLFKTLMSV